MSSATLSTRMAWYDRWTKPAVEQLIEGMKFPHRRQFTTLIEQLDAQPSLERTMVWYGASWKWTVCYSLPNSRKSSTKNGSSETDAVVCYLVPRAENPLVCVPMTNQFLEQLLHGQLGRYLKEGLQAAKCVIEIYWAHFSPGSQAEGEQVLTLLRKKIESLSLNCE